MTDILKCLKSIEPTLSDANSVRIGKHFYALKDASENDIKKGTACLELWRVEYEYEVMVSGGNTSHPYIDKHRETVSTPFSELIFLNDDCIGIYHEKMAFLFDDVKTHHQKKFLGEFITGPDRSRYVYDDYYLTKENA